MIVNKAVELATEGIPGCVLQLYVWLSNPEDAGEYALVSIVVSAICTGFSSATISYDYDVAVYVASERSEQVLNDGNEERTTDPRSETTERVANEGNSRSKSPCRFAPFWSLSDEYWC